MAAAFSRQSLALRAIIIYAVAHLAQAAISVKTGNNGASIGDKCEFPFVYAGVIYTSCSTVDNNNVGWCYTRSHVIHTTGQRKQPWGNCPADATAAMGAYYYKAAIKVISASNGATPGATCAFPFVYLKKIYTSCVSASGASWCPVQAHTVDTDGTRTYPWGVCPRSAATAATVFGSTSAATSSNKKWYSKKHAGLYWWGWLLVAIAILTCCLGTCCFWRFFGSELRYEVRTMGKPKQGLTVLKSPAPPPQFTSLTPQSPQYMPQHSDTLALDQQVVEIPAKQVLVEKPARRELVDIPAKRVWVDRPAERFLVERPPQRVVVQSPGAELSHETSLFAEQPEASTQIIASQGATIVNQYPSTAASPPPVPISRTEGHLLSPASQSLRHYQQLQRGGQFVSYASPAAARGMGSPVAGPPLVVRSQLPFHSPSPSPSHSHSHHSLSTRLAQSPYRATSAFVTPTRSPR